MYLLQNLILFWNATRPLLYGVSLLLGFYSIFEPLAIVPVLLLWIPLLKNLKLLIFSILLFTCAFFYGSFYYQFPDVPPEGIQGQAYINIEAVTSHKTFFGKMWVYRCQIHQFIPEGSTRSIARGIKCLASLPQKESISRPLATRDYIVKGTLQLSDQGQYVFKIDHGVTWLPVEWSWSFAEWRYQAKKWMSSRINKQYSNQKSAVFLASLAIGEFDDLLMQLEFARFGVQHIMAVSGFHFSILAAIMALFLRLFLPPKPVAIALMLFVTLYFLFLGTSASILRSWMAILIAMGGQFLGRQSRALNALGVGLIAILLIDPLLSHGVGFQFSFLATVTILLGFAPVDRLLCEVLPKRSLSQMVQMNGWNQHAYCLLTWFRQGLALSIVVTLLTWPLVIFYFDRFSLMSLLYNLFFPFLVSISMFFLLVGLLLGPLGGIIHSVNDIYTQWVLNLLYQMPKTIDIYYTWDHLSKGFLILYLSILLLAGIAWKSHTQSKNDFNFI